MTLEDTSLAFYRAWHIGVGAKHGLLLALRDAPLAPTDLARELGLAERAVADWCQGAWALRLLRRDARGRYQLAPKHRLTLGEPTSDRYLGHHFEYLTTKSLTFGAIDDLLHGKAPDVDLAATYAIATRYDHDATFRALGDRIRRALANGVDVLDLGAGHGAWTREAMRRFPRSRFTAADLDLAPLRDLPHVDARDLPASAFDLVYMGEVLAATKDPRDVLAAAYGALRPGGTLLLIEGLRPPEGRAPRGWGETLVLAMQLDFATDGSRYLNEADARAAIKAPGFARATVRDTGGSLFRIEARKPQTTRRE